MNRTRAAAAPPSVIGGPGFGFHATSLQLVPIKYGLGNFTATAFDALLEEVVSMSKACIEID